MLGAPRMRRLPGLTLFVLLPLAALAAPSRPNVLVILWDDIGFAQFGCYGSPLRTPNVDRLAAGGLRYTNFHTAPVCSPTRAALLTGRNPHAVGVATITEFANGEPNNRGGIRRGAGTIAEYLRGAGYGTYAVGKWHLTPMTEMNSAAASEHWPTGKGFDHFYGFASGETNQWVPELWQDRERLRPPAARRGGSPYHLDADLTDHAIAYLAEHAASQQAKPFLLYLAYGAGHAPHHVPADYLARWRGRFDQGWDAVREETLARQKQLGLVPADVQLPPRNPGVKAWVDLEPEERRLYARYYETFAAFVEHTDAQLGRLLDHLERSGQLENTLVILASDNGASPEGGPEGMWNEVRLFATNSFDRWAEGRAHLDELGTDRTYPTYPTGWTMAGSTPFRRNKGTAHMGGTRVPLIFHWPARIRDAGGIRPQFVDVVDLLPTALAAAGVEAPATLDGRAQQAIDGVDQAGTWAGAAVPPRRTTQYVEIYGHRAIYHDGWKAVTFHRPGQAYADDVWELYDLAKDFNETRDLAASRPDKLAELRAAWDREAAAHEVLPLDDRRAEREVLLPADAPQRGTRFEYFPPVIGLHKAAAPDFRGRAWRLSADLAGAAAGGSGVIAACGGRFTGWAFYLRGGQLVFHYNYGGFERTTVAGPLPAGALTPVAVSFAPLAAGAGAEVVLSAGGREVARGRVPHVLAIVSHESLDFGCDLYTPVAEDYQSPAPLAGPALRRVVIEADPYPR